MLTEIIFILPMVTLYKETNFLKKIAYVYFKAQQCTP